MIIQNSFAKMSLVSPVSPVVLGGYDAVISAVGIGSTLGIGQDFATFFGPFLK